jgi:hypothetical protein
MWYKDFEIVCVNESVERIYKVTDHIYAGKTDATYYPTFGAAAAYAIKRGKQRDEFEAMKQRDGLHVTRLSVNPKEWWRSAEYAQKVATTTWQQIAFFTDWSVIASWGVSKKQYLRWRDMPALALHVQGFAHTGWVIISLDEKAGEYEVELADEHFCAKDGSRRDGVSCDMLGEVIDGLVETGGLSKAEYDEKIKQEYPVECWAKEHGVQVVYL